MIAIIENKYNLTEGHIGIPFLLNEKPIGTVVKVNQVKVTINIFDKFIGFEFVDMYNPQIQAIYLSDKEQRPCEEVFNHIEV